MDCSGHDCWFLATERAGAEILCSDYGGQLPLYHWYTTGELVEFVHGGARSWNVVSSDLSGVVVGSGQVAELLDDRLKEK